MSVLRLHGFVLPGTPAGQDGPQHRRIDLGGLIALATDGPAVPAVMEANVEETLALGASHHRLLCACIRMGDVLPARPGAAFSSEAALRQALKPRVSKVLNRFQALRGRVEFAVQVRCASPAAATNAIRRGLGTPAHVDRDSGRADPPNGRAFLKARRDKREARNTRATARASFIAELFADLGEYIEAQAALATPDPDLVAHRACLVPRGSQPAVISALSAAAPAGEALGLDLSVIGPLPPYAFSEDTCATREREVAHV